MTILYAILNIAGTNILSGRKRNSKIEVPEEVLCLLHTMQNRLNTLPATLKVIIRHHARKCEIPTSITPIYSGSASKSKICAVNYRYANNRQHFFVRILYKLFYSNITNI